MGVGFDDGASLKPWTEVGVHRSGGRWWCVCGGYSKRHTGRGVWGQCSQRGLLSWHRPKSRVKAPSPKALSPKREREILQPLSNPEGF